MLDKSMNTYKAIIKANHKMYIKSLPEIEKTNSNIEQRFLNLKRKILGLLRKKEKSINSIKFLPTITRVLFGLQEDISRLKLPYYSFENEKKIINHFIISFLEDQKNTKFNGKCNYGETLLNLYLDVLITFTVLKTSREIEYNPNFLINPNSGQLLELDVFLEDFLLAFEFQGDFHYTETSKIEKDAFKLSKCAENKIILIPINIYQLKSNLLMPLILNTMKDTLGLKYFDEDVIKEEPHIITKSKHLLSFKKCCQRFYLAETLFEETIKWIDDFVTDYQVTQLIRSPISTTTEAPRLVRKTIDLSVKELYFKLKNV